MSTTSKKESFADMAFDGDKRAFAAWKDVIIGHLRQLSSQRAVDDLTAGRDPPALTYEEMLVQSVSLTSPGDEASDEEKRKYKLQQAMLKQQELYIKNLFNRTLPKPYRSQMTVSLNDQKVNAIWRQLEADYGQSSAQGMVEMVQEFEKALSLDFDNVTQLFQRLKGIRNRVNRHSVEAVQRQLIPSHLMMVKVLSLLPSQFWGSAVTFSPEEFTLEKLEEKMRNIFGDKSKAQILAMTKAVHVSHVRTKAKAVNHVKSQAQPRVTGKRRYTPEPEIANGQCFYCAGEHNVDGVPHAKKDCPKRAHDLNVAGVYRRNIFSEPKPLPKKMRVQKPAKPPAAPTRKEIPVDAATLQRLGIGPTADSQETAEDPPIPSPDVDISDDDLADFDELDATSISTAAAGIAELSMDMEQMDAGSG